VTFRELLASMQEFVDTHPNHEALDRQVVVRVSVPGVGNEEYLHVGGLQSVAVDAGCTDEFALVLDADNEDEVSA